MPSNSNMPLEAGMKPVDMSDLQQTSMQLAAHVLGSSCHALDSLDPACFWQRAAGCT